MEFNKQQIKECFNNKCNPLCEDCNLVGLPKEDGTYVYTCKLMLDTVSNKEVTHE